MIPCVQWRPPNGLVLWVFWSKNYILTRQSLLSKSDFWIPNLAWKNTKFHTPKPKKGCPGQEVMESRCDWWLKIITKRIYWGSSFNPRGCLTLIFEIWPIICQKIDTKFCLMKKSTIKKFLHFWAHISKINIRPLPGLNGDPQWICFVMILSYYSILVYSINPPSPHLLPSPLFNTLVV